MKIVIDIPEIQIESCRWHKNGQSSLLVLEVDMLAEAVANGTPLSEGKWIEHPNENGLFYDSSCFECNICHEWHDEKSDYCPWCGAKMGVDE